MLLNSADVFFLQQSTTLKTSRWIKLDFCIELITSANWEEKEKNRKKLAESFNERRRKRKCSKRTLSETNMKMDQSSENDSEVNNVK